MIKDAYLVGGVRTAIGSFCGAFEGTPAAVLGSDVVRAALTRARVQPGEVDEVIFGNVVGAGLGQTSPARSASAPACPLISAPPPSTRSAAPASKP